jgi:1-acyl-sn-glycerol-3-phosphate acyltransferase
MALRVIKVAWFMFLCLVSFTWRRVLQVQNQVALLDRDYLAWSKYVLRIFTIELTISGREHIPIRNHSNGSMRKLVIMSNHQSQLDIPSLVVAMDQRIGFVAKRELARIPILSYFMGQTGCVFIDRSDGRGANLVLEKVAKELGETPIVIFPEGTRSKAGGFLPLKQGGFRLALFADALIMPVLIQGTRNGAESRQEGVQTPLKASLQIFPVLDTRGLGEGKVASLKIKDYVEKCWQHPNDLI